MKKKKHNEFLAPQSVIFWFLHRYIHDEDAREFAYRLHYIISPDDLTINQRKKIKYKVQRQYTWLDFIIEKIDEGKYYIYPQHPTAEWARGEIVIDGQGFYEYHSRPIKSLFKELTGEPVNLAHVE